MRPIRSALFVPGHKADWIDKAVRSAADAVIIDLEDAVPQDHKDDARRNAREAIGRHGGDRTLLVRPNGLGSTEFARDVDAAAVAGLHAFLLPMLTGRDDVVRFDALITGAEIANGVDLRTIAVVPSFETAASISAVDDIVRGPRVGGVMAAAAKDADVSRSVGFQWTTQGTETLYLRSKILLAARAVGLRTILLGLWQDVRDLEGMRAFARANAGLGYTGQVVIHPTHAPIANEEYGISTDQADYYRRLISAFEAGRRAGHGAVSFEGEHVDLAHAENARERLRLAGVDIDGEDVP